MKKKLALLMAAIMLFAAAVPMNIFASSSATISRYYTNLDGGTTVPANAALIGAPGYVATGNELTYLVLKPTTPITKNTTFDLVLNNAEWNYSFAGGGQYTFPLTTWTDTDTDNVVDTGEITVADKATFFRNSPLNKHAATPTFESLPNVAYAQNDVPATISGISDGGPNPLLFTLTPAIRDTSRMTVEILGSMTNHTNPVDEIWIPLSFTLIDTAEVTLDIKVDSVTNSQITGQSGLVLVNAPTAAVISFKSVVESRDTFKLTEMKISEKRHGDLNDLGGTFNLVLPEGYAWNPRMTLVLEFEPAGVESVNTSNPYYNRFDYDVVGNTTPTYVRLGSTSGSSASLTDAGRVLEITIPAFERNSRVQSAQFYINGLEFVSTAGNSTFDEGINVSVTDYSRSYVSVAFIGGDGTPSNQAANRVTTPAQVNVDDNDTPNDTSDDTYLGTTGGYLKIVSASEPVKTAAVAKRLNYGIIFHTYKDAAPTEIWSGKAGQLTQYMEMKENTPLSWWPENETFFTLVDKEGNSLENKVKLTAVTVLGSNLSAVTPVLGYAPETSNVGEVGSYKRVYSNAFSVIAKDSLTTAKKGALQFRFSVSVAADFVGEIFVAASGRSIPSTETIAPVHVATVKAPVEIETKTTRIQIGYQVVPVEDVIITEVKAGLFVRGYNLEIRMEEYYKGLGSKMYFIDVEGVKVEMVSGDGLVGKAYASGSSVIIPVTRASSKTPISFKISGLKLSVDHTVPMGHYDFTVGGNAIVNNHTDAAPTSATFNRFGVRFLNYVDVATEGENIALSNNVVVTINEKIALSAGKQFDMGYEAYIDAATSRTMVPVRFLSYALGIEAKNVMWDPVLNKVTIITPERTVVFYKNSSDMTVNGSTMKMVDANGVICSTIIKDDRMFIPFKFIADAFGITVAWNETTKQAFYNPSDEQIKNGAVVVNN